MRFSALTIASAAVAAAGVNAIDVAGKSNILRSANGSPDISAEFPGYEVIPKAATNKYPVNAAPTIPDYATDSFEPTYVPEEDLKPTVLQARSAPLASSTANTTPVGDAPADDSFETFMEWMNARQAQGAFEQAQHSHVARSVAPSPSVEVPPFEGPADDTYEAFVAWMESRFPQEVTQATEQKVHARDVPAQPEHTSITAKDTPADDSYEEFVHWWSSRYPQGSTETDEHTNFARSVYEHDEYPSEYHELDARSMETPGGSEEHEDEVSDWSLVWNEELEQHIHARSLADEHHEVPSDYDYQQESSASGQGGPINVHYESEHEYNPDETFEEFLARQGCNPAEYTQETHPIESHEEEPQPQEPVHSRPEVSEVAASPAAAPTPKPTSAATSSDATSTSASQWTGETATASSGSAANVQARSVSSHYRFRHHSAHASNSGTATASSATSSTTSRKGFFNLPW
ncbi:unnamed protein product [Aureobasidium vineae]|uniref:Uncharacterized protein n=1 Tax=Aureobasidium vineae TaxID=2773715 RepID=A0A9N8JNZ7_9PEZI|nr:unnamed protein product [Aureobasidium vineae]